MARQDWAEWHEPYDDPGSALSQRLAVVQARLRDALDAAAPGPITAVSLCAGQGRDLLGVLADHPRAPDVRARLVELDGRNAEVARRRAADLGLDGVDVVTGDASTTDAYAGAVPADLVLACGIFGNVTDDDIRRCVGALPMLCAPGATVLWTRHRLAPDLTPAIRRWFSESGFEEVAFEPAGESMGVGAARFAGEPLPLEPGRRLFTFVGYEELLR